MMRFLCLKQVVIKPRLIERLLQTNYEHLTYAFEVFLSLEKLQIEHRFYPEYIEFSFGFCSAFCIVG